MRLGSASGGVPKALVPIAGRPMLEWALDEVLVADVQSVVVVAPPGELVRVAAMVRTRSDARIVVVAGGAIRQQSVRFGLDAMPADTDIVLVHDAARPLAPAWLFDAVRASVADGGDGVVPALGVVDTIKQVDDGAVVATIDRSRLAAVQTPQGFPAAALVSAYESAELEYTDDAALFAAAGGSVRLVPGDESAFKITTPNDLRRIEQLLRPPGDAHRVGTGVDAHAFDAEIPLWLGGVHWPGEPGLAGHSDGDVVCHAVADALLAAANLGDLGSVFGVDRPEEAGRAGVTFVERATAMLARAGYRPVNVTVQVLGNRPRLSTRRAEMEAAVGSAVGAVVSISGTTTDGMGFTGRGEGLAATATALVVRQPQPSHRARP